MDFTTLLSIAQKNERHNKSKEIGGYKTELSVAKRESSKKHEKPRSPVVQKLIDEKRREKEMAERKHKERKHEHKHKTTGDKHGHSHKNKVEKDNKKFTIPRKKETIDTLLKDLDSDGDNSDSGNNITDKHVSDSPDSRSNKSETKHKHHKSSTSKHRTDHRRHKGENHKSEHDQSAKKHQSSSESTKHGVKSSHKDQETNSHKDRKPDSSSSKHESSNKDRKLDSSSSKHGSSNKDRKLDSSSSRHGSSNKDKERQVKDSPVYKDNASKSSNNHKMEKKKAKDLSLQELREQVKRMKDEEAMISKQEEKPTSDPATDLLKQRTGLQANDEGEARKAKILSKTQMILERTKARLAEEQEKKRQPRQKGRRSNEKGERSSGKEGDKVKSRSVIKDDYDSDDDDDPNAALDLSSNQELMRNESGDILKNIKKKIDEKLGDYNFPDKPMKERKVKTSPSSGKRDTSGKMKSRHSASHMDRQRDKHKDRMRDREREKREKIKEMMRKDYKSSFSGDSSEQQKPRKPAIVRRFHQQQPPPMNFNDLLKIAEQKSKRSVPELNIIKPIKKKVEERLLTQEELDRRKRAEDVKRRRQAEEATYQKGASSANEQKTQPNSLKSKSDSSLLKGALTGKSAISNKSSVSAKQKTVTDNKGTKYDTENENVLVCKPSSSNVKKQRPVETAPATNPWDRIYGQIQQRNPKAEKRKRAVLESSDEEDEYDEEDDFIDDDDCGEDYSAHIRNIFGYDKRKYKFEDEDDVDNMEANFTTIMKEEARSAKIGKMEDLEDIRREEEEERLKRLAKKNKRR